MEMANKKDLIIDIVLDEAEDFRPRYLCRRGMGSNANEVFMGKTDTITWALDRPFTVKFKTVDSPHLPAPSPFEDWDTYEKNAVLDGSVYVVRGTVSQDNAKKGGPGKRHKYGIIVPGKPELDPEIIIER